MDAYEQTAVRVIAAVLTIIVAGEVILHSVAPTLHHLAAVLR